jgi:hydroxymethylpyrimidine/phosphomethylpyrimidine kinase
MLGNGDVIEAVCQVLEKDAMGIPLVVDPVMAAKGGASLLDAAAVEVLKSRLLPLAAVLTPNLPEAEALTGGTVRAVGDMEAAAAALLATGAKAVLLKGGHLDGCVVTDLLITADGSRRFESPRIRSRHTHGTGCTLASGVAVGLAQGLDLGAAVARARAYVAEAIRGAPGLGGGHGPLNHGHTVKPFE